VKRIVNWIDGSATPPKADRWLDNVDPATGETIARVADSDAADVDRAVDAARRAFPAWAATPAADRSRQLHRIADALKSRIDDFARAESEDSGKPLTAAGTVDIPRAVTNFRFFADAILHGEDQAHLIDRSALNYTLRRPRGVAGLISPWNLPLYLLTWKIAPALATGNTVVAKPSELTPTTAFMLGELTGEAGLAPGVLNIVQGHGAGCGAAIVDHKDVPAISFTGGTITGRAIATSAASQFKKVALELGGKNPTLVFDDVDIDRVAAEATRAAFSNQGQICLCGSRLLLHEAIYEPFVDRLVEHAKRLRCGDPLEDGTTQGALISADHLRKVQGFIETAQEAGGVIRCGGKPPEDLPPRVRDGAFLEPTVITGLPDDCRVLHEEIFGPVLTVQSFRDESRALALANGTPYGLAASVWTRDLDRAHRVADALHSGTVWVNCWMLRDLRVPFGGMKSSGVGREGGREALEFFTEPKNVCLKLDDSIPPEPL